MFDNIGGKIKGLASVCCVLEMLASIITGIILIATDEDLVTYGIVTLFAGSLFGIGSSWLIYGFGELIEKVNRIEESICKSDSEISQKGKTANSMDSAVIENPSFEQVPKSVVPYWCKECGQEGPYIGKCPKCGCASIRYE